MRNRTICVYLTFVAMFWPALSQLGAQTAGTPPQDVIDVWHRMSQAKVAIELIRQGEPIPALLSGEELRLREQLSTMMRSLTNEQRDDVARAVIKSLAKRTPENWRLTQHAIGFLSLLNTGAPDGLDTDVRLHAAKTLASIIQSTNDNYNVRRVAIMDLPRLDPDSVGVAVLAATARENPPSLTVNYMIPYDALGALGGYDTIEATDALLAMWNDPAMRNNSIYQAKILTSLSGKSDDRAYRVVSEWLNGADLRRNGPEVSVLLGQGVLARRLDGLKTPTADERRRLEDIRSRFISILRRADEVHPEVLEQAAVRLAWITPPDDLKRIELLNQIIPRLPEARHNDIPFALKKAAKRHAGEQSSGR